MFTKKKGQPECATTKIHIMQGKWERP